ncbi:MAG: hydroxyacid dehydrogenase [Sphingopyxis terrae]|nr:MAG: hydroxyacid dehydrogenase [Sphingopyxis terrae]
MRPKVVVTQPAHEEALAALREICDVVVNNSGATWDRAKLVSECRGADAILAFMTDRVDDAFLDACPRLRMIGCALKGYDNFDIEACTRRGVVVSAVPDLLTEPTAELAIGLLLGLARNIAEGDRHVRSGAFAGWRPILYGKGLYDSTVGILGMGAVGRAVARRLAGFECRIRYFDPKGSMPETAPAEALALLPLLAESDFIVVAAPLHHGSHHLIDRETIGQMRNDVRIVNVGRGSVVDESAVAEALLSGRIAGYAADVFEFEDWALAGRPDGIDQRLIDASSRTLFTPHLGSAVDATRREIVRSAASSILQVLRRERPDNALNFEALSAQRPAG